MSASEHEKRVTVRLHREEAFRLKVEFEDEHTPPLVVDEHPPLGEGAGPTGVELLASAVGTCLSQSLLFCLQRSRIDVESLDTEVEATVGRNDQGRLRVLGIQARLRPVLAGNGEGEAGSGRMKRCLGLFEEFCTVAQSIGAGIPIEVTVTEEEPAGTAGG